ncbi:hypothetical protein OFQ52_06670 [Brachyspira hyodysenteriae]|nr:hypothetical protein [Brachyspira hyodysenteriae]MCZ9839423.1 hypothetical protein [Brachyspira hyodysenteriae]MCZ9847072.1 hypothetical protein [Brachyspira hyodysenteriae]MCZ9872769.1 hypothetical protein [Brachyspira hyodysenteriae]MCZ9930456.1 hypothetical protein [Brachyspira hyodysenteriae]
MDLENTENVENNNNNEEEVKAKGERKAHFNKELNEKTEEKNSLRKKYATSAKTILMF